jgi:hypothetical protein
MAAAARAEAEHGGVLVVLSPDADEPVSVAVARAAHMARSLHTKLQQRAHAARLAALGATAPTPKQQQQQQHQQQRSLGFLSDRDIDAAAANSRVDVWSACLGCGYD